MPHIFCHVYCATFTQYILTVIYHDNKDFYFNAKMISEAANSGQVE